MERKYFFFDIDDTLTVPDGDFKTVIPESVHLTIRKLMENGHIVSIATGRSYAMAKDTMDQLGIVNAVHDGGNGVTVNCQCLGVDPLPYKECAELYENCDDLGIPISFNPVRERIRYVSEKNKLFFKTNPFIETRIVKDLDIRKFSQVYKMFVLIKDIDKLNKMDSFQKLPSIHYGGDFIVIEPMNKSVGIKKMVDFLGGDYKDVVVFGDNYNDLSMFTNEWTCIAMGNAVDTLKEKATYVTAKNTEDGIYKACTYFGWI